jgi:hypothetical protein
MTIRVMPPADGLHPSITVFGRGYTCALGSTLDVPPGDAQVMISNGWSTSSDTMGATAARPAAPAKGQQFHDSTVGYNIVFDGKVWRNPTSGAAV